MRWLLLALLLVAPVVGAQAGAREVNLVVWHASPDPRAGGPDADPFSSGRALSPATARLPLTLVDGTLRAEDAPEGDPTNVGAHYREVQRLLQLAERSAGPLELRVGGSVTDGTLRIDARVAANVSLAGALVEDNLEHEGASGVRVHRHVARAALERVDAATARWNVTLDPKWDVGRASVVVWALGPNGTVLQSARWRLDDPDGVVQLRKAVLVEHVTATWCVPCAPSDEALALLSAQAGEAGGAAAAGGYLRAPGPAALVGIALGFGAAAILLWRRHG